MLWKMNLYLLSIYIVLKQLAASLSMVPFWRAPSWFSPTGGPSDMAGRREPGLYAPLFLSTVQGDTPFFNAKAHPA